MHINSTTLFLVVQVLSAFTLLIDVDRAALTRCGCWIGSWTLRSAFFYLRSVLFRLFFTYCQSEVSDTLKDLFVCFCTYFCEFKAVFLYQVSRFLWLNKSYLSIDLFIAVTLVSQQENFSIFVAVIESLGNPEIFDIF